MSANMFENQIRDAARSENDVRLAEAIYAYFLSIKDVEYLPWKTLKSFFVAARAKDSETWNNLSEEEIDAIEDVLLWTGYSANTIAVILRTYERSSSELKDAQREGRITRYPAASISRLYKGPLKDLQPRLLEMYLKYRMTNEELKSLVQELEKTLTRKEQEEVLKKYTPEPPITEDDSLFNILRSNDESQYDESSQDDKKILLLSERKLEDLERLSDDELWELKGITEKALEQPTQVLQASLDHIKDEIKKRL
jgi:hypothetical protein